MQRLVLIVGAAVAADAMYCDKAMSCVCTTKPCDFFDCSASQSCDTALLVCDSTSCPMSCSGRDSCRESHMQCISDMCSVTCSQEGACADLKTYKDSGIATAAALDPIGRDYGMWLAAGASTGHVVCSAAQACSRTAIGCASAQCQLDCGEEEACAQASYTVHSTAQEAAVQCTEGQACAQAKFDFSSSSAEGLQLLCSGEESCAEATVLCPADQSLTVVCSSRRSCSQLAVTAPSTLPAGKQCLLQCVGDEACAGIAEAQVTGAVTAVCDAAAGCPAFLTGGASTTAPCSTWRVKVVGVTIDCMQVCTVLLDTALCESACECADTTATSAPTPLPIAQTDAPVVPSCDNWTSRVPGFTECTDLCTSTSPAKVQLCSTMCTCGTAAPATHTPPVGCTTWRVKVVGVAIDCMQVCTVLLDTALCESACECADTTATSAPTPLPIAQTDVPVVPGCDNWTSRVPGFTECADLCTSTSPAKMQLCSTLCTCGTAAPATPTPPVGCTTWRVKVVGVAIDCMQVCTVLLITALCESACECADTTATSAPTPLPIAQTDAPVVPSCDNWTSRVPGFTECADLCTSTSPAKVQLCSTLCTCGTATPARPTPGCTTWTRKAITNATLPSLLQCSELCTTPLLAPLCTEVCECADATGAPSTAPTTPDTPPPGTVVTTRRLFRLVLAIVLDLFDSAAFTTDLQFLLNTSISLKWVCPGTACAPTCPSSVAAKMAAGCLPGFSLTGRRARVLQASQGSVAEFGVAYTPTRTEAEVAAALQSQVANSSAALASYGLEEVAVVDTEVLEGVPDTASPGTGDCDDGLSTLHIALIASGAVVVLLVVAAVVVLCLRRTKPSNENLKEDSHEPDTV